MLQGNYAEYGEKAFYAEYNASGNSHRDEHVKKFARNIKEKDVV